MIKQCPQCGVEMRHHDVKQAEDCWFLYKSDESTQQFVTEAIARCDVSPMFGKQTFEASDESAMAHNPESWDAAKAWLDSGARCLYLYGPPGTGKTYAGRCVLYDALKSRTQEKPYVSVIELSAYKMLKNASSFGAVAEYLNMRLELCDYLMIDDIDKPTWTANHVSFFWNLLNERYDKGGRIIITTNINPDKFRDIFKGVSNSNNSKVTAAIERLHPVTQAEFKGESLRRLSL